MSQKPYQRFYHLGHEPSVQLPEEYRNLLLDEQSGSTSGYVQSAVTKRSGRTIDKSSDSLVMRRNRRSRTVFTNEQVAELEYQFSKCNFVNSERAEELAAKLSLEAAPVKYWFKNQRRRIKVKETEKQTTDTLQPDELKVTTDSVASVPNFVCQVLHLSSPSPQPTPPPSITDVGTPYSFNPNYYNHPSYSSKQASGYQLLQQVATSTPTHFVQSAPSSATPKLTNALISQQLLHQSHSTALNFNNITYLTSMPVATTDDTHSSTTASNNSDTSDYCSQMSPNSEPLTPNSGLSEAESVFNDILDSLKTPKTLPTMENIYEKLISAPEPNFNCALDTILQPYNNHQSPANNNQLTYLELA